MKKILFIVSASALVLSVLFIESCKKDDPKLPLEPITLVKPDTAIIRQFPGDVLPIELTFTTDRPINWINCMYDIDSTHTTGYVATYPDTLFFVKLDTLDPRVNIYTYTTSYYVPDTLNPYDVVRFKVSFEAGKSTFTTGQNYPAGIVGFSKEFRIDVR
ncbi:MAG: hypothetical protein KIS94_12520 [Chitinophagales bacterium]|nr:hypothetical protein [Chitinophagales bacterium]